jgi:uncharacterized Zn finger protein
MKLQDLTDKAIKQFAGSVIFDRGYNYYVNKLAYDLQYDSDADSIQAQVSGNYGDYDVNITAASGHLSAGCNCPYEGYPCKHIVAVLLTFIHDQDAYIQQAKATKKAESSLTKKVKALSKDELVEILLSCSKRYPDVKRDLMVRLGSDKKATFSSIKRQIVGAFPSIESYNYSTYNIAKQLKTILKSVENASSEIQIKVYWEVIDRTLEELDAYGMQDETLEGVAIDTMEMLVEAFADKDSLQKEKAEIIAQLLKYYHSGNFGITDWVYDTAVGLCNEKSDYKIVIKSLERHMKGNSFTSYYQELIADLYAAIGDTEAQRKTLEANLQYGMDYWRLAEYWFEEGNKEKAWEVVHKGLEKGEGRKIELYEVLQKHYQKRKEYEKIFELLQRKIEHNELDHGHSFKLDSTYQCLWNRYNKQNDYEGMCKLLEMRLHNNDIDLEFYKEAEKALNENDWQSFEADIIKNLQTRIQEQQQKRKQHGFYFSPLYPSSETSILAEIYHYKKDSDRLFKIVKSNIDLLRKYESLLMPHYTNEYLEQYRKKIDQLIAARGRKHYQAAVPYAKTVKKLYTEILHKPDGWTQYITNLRQKNKTLRAFQEEFARL